MTGTGQAPRRNFSEPLRSIRAMRTAHQWYGMTLRRWDGLTKPSRRTNEPWNSIHSRSSLIRIWDMTFYYARQYDQAIEQERKTMELDPNFLPAHDYLGLAYRPKVHVQGRHRRNLKRRWRFLPTTHKHYRDSDTPMLSQVEEQKRRRCSIN